MRTRRAGRKEDDVPRRELFFPIRMPQRGGARDDKEPFLFRFFVVIGTHSFAGRQLIDAEPGALRAQGRSDSNAVSPEAIRELRTRRTSNRAEIDSPNRVSAH